ncbi:hypothetical protein K1719_013531 [Acacia pycnantha]|nr:hypothetical protein K1719_013531 [Acacia pycnantha]
MAFFISRRLTNILLTSSRSSSLHLLSLPSTTISKSSTQFYLLHASSSSTPSYPTQKPQILEPCFIRSAPFATFRPSKPTFSPANNNPETPCSGQNPNSIHTSLLENELRDLLRKSMDNIRGLKNALTVLGFVHIVPLWLASKMKQSWHLMSLFNMKREEGLFLPSRFAWLAARRLLVAVISVIFVQLGVLFFLPSDIKIPRIKISTIAMALFPMLCGLQIYRMPSVSSQMLRWELEGKVGGLLLSSNRMEQLKVLRVVNIFLLRLKNASYLGAGLSCSWLLLVHLQSHGFLKFLVFK